MGTMIPGGDKTENRHILRVLYIGLGRITLIFVKNGDLFHILNNQTTLHHLGIIYYKNSNYSFHRMSFEVRFLNIAERSIIDRRFANSLSHYTGNHEA